MCRVRIVQVGPTVKLSEHYCNDDDNYSMDEYCNDV